MILRTLAVVVAITAPAAGQELRQPLSIRKAFDVEGATPHRAEKPPVPGRVPVMDDVALDEVISLASRLERGEGLAAWELKRVAKLLASLVDGPKPTDLPLTAEFIAQNDALPKKDRAILRSRHVDVKTADARYFAGHLLTLAEKLPDYPRGSRLMYWEAVTPVGENMLLVSGVLSTGPRGSDNQRVTVGMDKNEDSPGWKPVFVRRGGKNYYPSLWEDRTRRIVSKAQETEAGREILELH